MYLAGHSRGGALVLRLAKKFQQEFPNAVVIVHTFDPVPNKSHGELGVFNSSIDNPSAGYPRDTALLENKGNWAWRSNFRTYYEHKKNFSVFNMLIGGQIFGLAQETRAVTIDTGYAQGEDLGWYFQRWYNMLSLGFPPVPSLPPLPGFQSQDGDGHTEIAKTTRTVNHALEHVRDRLNVLLNNIAPAATASASSSYCEPSGLNCYSPLRINDTDLDTRVGADFSWTNEVDSASEWVKLTWPELINTNYIEIFTSEGLPIRNYRIEYFDGSNWRTIQ
ncbi:MAG: hypothetical protein F6J94_19775 [Moorea sp. SIO1F2]|uniref:hypothetical protein n=1 Tax=Moorena sp. SIO1F2 TaxID=2607819 RepID=UPI0013BB100E|nr:hypothetical protein [Moorena sp. SIO1F2]NET84072.1 hypothetical protein [Moorena sp. SIO1F2]